MTYVGELRQNWRALAAATLGFASALSINGFIHSILGPYLIEDFQWSRTQFALLSSVQLLVVLLMPVAGRLADLFGVRAAALPGVVIYPLTFVAMSQMTGDIAIYYGLYIVQLVFCVTTTATVYCRVVAERFQGARGLALGIMACGPPVVAALGSPLLDSYMAENGWRAGCLIFALFSAVSGAAAMLLMPGSARPQEKAAPRRSARQDYPAILRHRGFWIIFIGAFLTSIPFALAQGQLNLMLSDRGLPPSVATFIISIFSAGVFAGRLLLGISLDRFPTHIVAATGMTLSAAGLLILASPVSAPILLMLGVGLLGLAYGAESDIIGYAVVRYFGIAVYSTVLGLMTAGMAAAMTIGGILLGITLKATGDSYQLFMVIGGIATLIGAANFLRLRSLPEAPDPAAERSEASA